MTIKLNRRQVTATLAFSLAAPALIPSRSYASNAINVMGNEAYMPKDVRDAFTQETGIRINFKSTPDQPQIMNALASEGSSRQTDLITVVGHRVYSYLAADYISPLDEKALPSLSKINPLFLDDRSQFINEQHYAVPVLIGFSLIASRKGVVSDAHGQSWESIFGHHYDGRITNRTGSALFAAMFYLGRQDVWFNYSGDDAAVEKMLQECRSFVVANKGTLRKWYESTPEFHQMFIGGEVDVGLGLTQSAIILASEMPEIRAAIPVEGTTGWTINYAFLKGSQNQEGAYRFVEFLLSRQDIGATITRSTGSPSTFIDGTDGLTEAEKSAFSLSDEELQRIGWLDIRGADDQRYVLFDKYTTGLREA